MNFRQLLGIALLALSTLTWLAVPVIVLLYIAVAEKVAWSGGSYAVSLVTWWLCLLLLGPELMGQFRRWWQRFRTAARSAVDPDH